MRTAQLTTIMALALALALAVPGATAALTSSGPSLNASLTYYEPIPALPGNLLDVFVQISNGGGSTEKVFVEFVDNNPFSIDNEQDRVRSVGSIPAQGSYLAKYTVRVSEDATPGTAYIKIRYYSGSEANAQTALLPVTVFSSSVALGIENLKVEPETFVPGSKGTVSFVLHNFAPLTVSDGFVQLDLEDVDIAPLGSTNQQRFTSIRQGQTRAFSFMLIPSPELDPGVYKIPILLEFKDQQGNSYSLTETMGIVVGSAPQVSVVIDESAITGKQSSGDLTFRVTNQGLGEVKFVNLELLSGDGYKILGSSPTQYIGNIDSDDYKTARVAIRATGSGDTLDVPVRITFTDALNNPHTQETTLTIELPEGEGGGSGKWVFLLVIIVVIVGYVLWRRKKR